MFYRRLAAALAIVGALTGPALAQQQLHWYHIAMVQIPDPTLPPGKAPGYWYYCDNSRQYYPYVSTCARGWRAVTP